MGIENPVHLIFIGIVALLVLGPKRLPELARALGHGIREFREAVSNPGETAPTAIVQAPGSHTPVAQASPLAEPSATHTPVPQPGPAADRTPLTVDSTPEEEPQAASSPVDPA
jgi:TatA/E family protein of Tat protein translocase